MLYFKRVPGGKVVKVSEEHIRNDDPDYVVVDRWDLKSFDQAEELAEEAYRATGELFLACDKGEWVTPRYDVIRAPKVGNPVSFGFNGDYYPDGYITKVGGTNCSRVYTDTGSVYRRRRRSATWLKAGGTWCMVSGHIDERNPHF